MNPISKMDDQTLIKVYVQPGASKNEFVGHYGEPPRLKIKIKAQPQDGEANAEVITFLLRGHTSRQKDVVIEMDYHEVVKKIPE